MPDLQSIYRQLVRVQAQLCNAIDRRLRAELDLPLTKFEPMQIMSRSGTCRVEDLAMELGITVGGITRTVDQIEAAGHCRRRANPIDRRSSLIDLTPAGHRLLGQAEVIFQEELELRLRSGLSARSLERFAAALVRLRSVGERVERA